MNTFVSWWSSTAMWATSNYIDTASLLSLVLLTCLFQLVNKLLQQWWLNNVVTALLSRLNKIVDNVHASRTILFKLVSSTLFMLTSLTLFKLVSSTLFMLTSLTLFTLVSSTMFMLPTAKLCSCWSAELLVHAGQLNHVHAGQFNLVHAGQLNVVHVGQLNHVHAGHF